MSDALDTAYVEIDADFSDFNRSVETGIRNASRVLENRIRATIASSERRFGSFGSGISSTTERAFREMASDADDAFDDIDDSIDRVNRRRISLDVDVDNEGTFSRFLSSITGVRLPTAGFAALGTAASAAAAAVIQMGAALTPAVGIIAGLPATVGVAAAAIGTLQVATAGFSDAMSAAFEGAETFDAAIEDLSPNAQAAAEAFRAVVPELQALQDTVQDAFFADMDDAITGMAETLIGPLSEGMSTAAGYAGGIVTELLNIAGSQTGVDFITTSFATLNAILAQLQEPTAALFTAFLELGTAVNTAFGGEAAGAGLASMIQRLADFISAATASGQAVSWIENALAVFQQIGAILSPIVGIIASIGSAAAATGGNILGVFGESLQVLDDFFASAQGQDVLITLFEALNEVGAGLALVLANIAPALVPIIEGFSGIISVVSPLLGPLSELVGSVLTALAPLLTIVAAALEPLIEPLTEIIEMLGPILTEAITALMPIVELLVDLLGGVLSVALELVATVLEALAPIITVVLEALTPLIEALTPLFSVLGLIAELIGTVLEPVIQVLGAVLLWLVENIILPFLIPAIETLVQILTVVLVEAITAVQLYFEMLGQAALLVWENIKEFVTNNVQAIQIAWQTMVSLFKAGWSTLNNAVFTPVKNGFNTLKTVATAALSNVRGAFNDFVSAVRAIPGKISNALSNMFSPLWSGFRSAINSVIDGWNSLSFSIPSIDLGSLGSYGGFTVSTPNISRLQTGGMSMGEGIAYLDPNEAILPLEDSRTTELLANALSQALSQLSGGGGDTSTSGGVYVDVRIGDTELNDIIDTRISESNTTATRRARAGTGNRA